MTLKKLDDPNYSTPTRLIHGDSFSAQWDYSFHVVPPITASSTFRLGSTQRGADGFEAVGHSDVRSPLDPIYVYDRLGEPTNVMLQNALAIAEGGDCSVTYATGMAAVHAAVTFSLFPGAEVISHRTIYGCSYSLFTNWLPKFSFNVHFTDLRDPRTILPLINENTRLVYLESPVNPSMELIDIEALCKLVADVNKSRPSDRQILTAIDNTFATPIGQRPLSLGIDLVIHSLTKGISGFGTEMGGAVVTRKEFFDGLLLHRKDFGSTLSPHTAWSILTHGLPTLPLRIPKQQASAQAIAQFLEQHPAVETVKYPGLPSFPQHDLAKKQMVDFNGAFAPGFMIYFLLKGESPAESRKRGQTMMDFMAENSYTVTLAVSLGQIRTLIEHPASMTHSSYTADEQVKRGIDPGGIRLAVGIEDAQDIIRDLRTALDRC